MALDILGISIIFDMALGNYNVVPSNIFTRRDSGLVV